MIQTMPSIDNTVELTPALMEQKIFSVWVGGVEVNDNYVDYKEAQAIADHYLEENYGDVVIATNDGSYEETPVI